LAAARIAAGILVSRLFGLLREQLAARYFGVGPLGDVYGTAMRLPNLLQNLLGEQTLSAAFIPGYSRLLGEGKGREAGRFAGAALGLLLLAALGLALAGVLLAEPLVRVFAAGYLADAEQVRAGAMTVDRFPLAVDLVRILFPMAGLLVLSAWALAVLNSHRRFFLPYVAPVAWNAAIIAALWWWGSHLAGGGLDEAGRTRLLYVVAWAALAGGALQLLVQLPAVARLLTGFRLSLGRRVEGIPEALRAVGPVVAGRGVVQLSGYLDAFLATLLAAGAVAAQRFALTLYMLPISLFAMSVAASELPELSRLRGEDADAQRERLRRGVRQICFLTVPTAVGFLAFGWLLVGVLFGGGAFGRQDQLLVSLVLAGYTLGLLPTTVARLLQNHFYARQETRYPARVATARVALATLIGLALMTWLDRQGVGAWTGGPVGAGELRLGAVGLALGSACGGWLELALLLRGARRFAPLALPFAAVARLLVLALAAAALAASAWWWLAARPLPPLVVGLAVPALFAACYLGGAAALRLPELQAWTGRFRRAT
jgi:putative peptidoglycan lipid II flippase